MLYEKFHLLFIFTGEKAEYAYIEAIANAIPYPSKVYAGKTTLLELKTLLKNAFLTVSASLHISSVQKTPSIGIFGATNWIKYAPFGSWSTVVHDPIFYRNEIPPIKNSEEMNNYYNHITILPALKTLNFYLN